MHEIFDYLNDTVIIVRRLYRQQRIIRKFILLLSALKRTKGRLFVLGNGGSAGTASHAVNDFRKLNSLEAYSPSDNVSELTARVNDESWQSAYASWLVGSKINKKDVVLILSVSGGGLVGYSSTNLIEAVSVTKKAGAVVLAITGDAGSLLSKEADYAINVPHLGNAVFGHTEGLTSVILHLISNHSDLRGNE